MRTTGPDSSDRERLVLAGLEFNGTLSGDSLLEEPSSEPSIRQFRHSPANDGEPGGAEGFLTYLSVGNEPRTPRNPALLGHISIEASGFLTTEQVLYQLLDPVAEVVETTAEPDSWISFSLPDRQKFSVSSYRLSPLPDSDDLPLEEWVLEGSNNRQNWEVLHDGTGSDPATQDREGFVWHLPTGLPAYRHLRIRMTGAASREATPVRLAGLEFWGDFLGDRFSDPANFDPPCTGQNFTYQEDFDGRGIIAHLATNGGTREYQNPAVLGLLQTSASSLASDSEPAYSIVGDAAVRCVTRSQNNAWFEVDFGQNAVIPNHYSLRHYSSWDTEALRNWVLEASNDGETWITLRNHTNDTALFGRGDTASWPLEALDTPIGFRKFRVRQTGPNANAHLFLALSGFEIYGTFCPQEAPAPVPEVPRSFPFADESSTGVVEFLATSNGVESYRNPAALGRMTVEASSLMRDSEPATAAVGDQSVRCVTKPILDSWFKFDFGNLWIAPTHYRLRHYSSWDTEALRSWVFEGSNDGAT